MTKFYKNFPNYDDDSDYNTNATSYYKDLGRKTKLIKLLAKRIWEYENTLNETLEQIEQRLTDYITENDELMNERLENWDKRIDGLDEEVSHIFVEWLNDGTLEQIINDDVLGNKADKTYVDELNEEVTTEIGQIAMSVLNFGAVGDGIHDDRQAIQDGIDYLNSVGGGTLLFPKGYTFLLNSRTYVSENVIIGLKDGVSLDGEGTIKIADNFGDYHSIFNFVERVNNVSYRNFTVDENTRGNPMVNLPNTAGDGKNTRTTFFLWKRDSENVTIENVMINDCLGVWQITSGRTHNLNIKNNTINYTEHTPEISYDRTSIYFGAVGGVLAGNILNGSEFSLTALELHGDNIMVYNNQVYGYKGFMFIVNDGEMIEKINNIKVFNNIGKTSGGVTLWFQEDNVDVDNVEIYNNTLYLESSSLENRSLLATYALMGENVTVKNVVFKDNEIFLLGGTNKVFSFGSPATTTDLKGINFEKVTIKGNTIQGNVNTFLLLERSGTTNPDYYIIEDLEVCNNVFIGECVKGVSMITNEDSFKHVIVENNEFKLNSFSSEQSFIRHDSAVSGTNPLVFKNNVFTNIMPEKLVEYGGVSFDFIVKQELNNLVLTTNNIRTSKMANGSVLYDNFGNTISKENDKWVISKKTDNVPVHEYLTEGSIIWLTDSSDNIGYKVTNNGYVADHGISTGLHKKGEWVSYGMFVAEVLIDNTFSENSAISENPEVFKYLGDKATISTI